VHALYKVGQKQEKSDFITQAQLNQQVRGDMSYIKLRK
jgi:hypothetical protein